MVRELVILRHSKAEPAPTASGSPDDQQRSLTLRGRRDAVAAGALLAGLGVRPQQALVSIAARAQQTWEGVAEGMKVDLAPRLESTLYSGSEDAALQLIRGLDSDLESVIVVGHNPTMEAMALLLDDSAGDPEAMHSLREDFPTSAFAVFTVSGSWDRVAAGSARLQHFGVGRG